MMVKNVKVSIFLAIYPGDLSGLFNGSISSTVNTTAGDFHGIISNAGVADEVL